MGRAEGQFSSFDERSYNLAIAKSTSQPKRSRIRSVASQQPGQTDVRLGRIIRVLLRHPTVVLSGTKLAQEIGTNRSEVWRLIQQLRTLGVDIAGHPATGYQLRSVPDLLLPDALAPLVQGTIFAGHLHHYFKIGSTNSAAMEAAASGAPEGSVFLSEEQTAGRGRGAHNWHSAQGAGIYCSVVLRPALPPADVLVLSLAAGLAVCTAVSGVAESIGLPVDLDLKWPNDVLLGQRKFCGILTEMNAEATRVRYVVVGIGMNVNHDHFPASLLREAVSLRMLTGSDWSRVELAGALLKSLDREYREVLKGAEGRDSILKRFSEKSSYVRGKRVRVEENGGFEGMTEGLDARGFLQVRTSEGMRLVLSGSVRPVESAAAL